MHWQILDGQCVVHFHFCILVLPILQSYFIPTSTYTHSLLQKRGKISFFEHVFIHDYQSETAATSDWDFQNGTSLSSYTPAAVRQYEDVESKVYTPEPSPMPAAHIAPPAPPPDDKWEEPLITYGEEETVDFTGSSDGTAGALLF